MSCTSAINAQSNTDTFRHYARAMRPAQMPDHSLDADWNRGVKGSKFTNSDFFL